ncbi:MAG: GNAT family N-acetyltransferase [Chloroflexota bacterium]
MWRRCSAATATRAAGASRGGLGARDGPSGRRDAPETLRWQIASASLPPGFLAYLDGEIAGWCGVGLRAELPRLRDSKTLPAIDDAPVWSIGCFKIRPGYRRQGVARALLDGIVRAAREAGAPGVEAYPIDSGGGRVDAGFAFVGLASMFDDAGFRRAAETGGHSAGLPRIRVRLDF